MSNRFISSIVVHVVMLGGVLGVPYSVLARDALLSEQEIKQLGLVEHWRGAIERARTGLGNTTVVLWPHSRHRKQLVTVRIGDRVVEQIDANQVLISSPLWGSKTNTDADAKGIEEVMPPRLGLEAAMAQAKAVVKRYQLVGKTATIDDPVDQPMTYLVSASKSGGVQAINADTGEALWSTSVGDPRLPTIGPGVNDHYVSLVNGNELFILDLETGRQLLNRRLDETASGIPVPVGGLIYVPSIRGTMSAFDANSPVAPPITMRFANPLSNEVVPSLDRKFVAWPEKSNLYIAQAGRRFAQWSGLAASASFRAPPEATQDGYVICSSVGMVYRVNLQRLNSMVWRQNLAQQVSRPLFIGSGLIMVISDTGTCTALDEISGDPKWRAESFDMDRIVAMSDTKIYGQRLGGQLVVIDNRDGRTLAASSRPLPNAIVNRMNDRILLQTELGDLLCLREPQAHNPIANVRRGAEPTSVKPDAASVAADSPVVTETASAAPSAFDSPFESAPSSAPAMAEDPFSASPSPAAPAGADPFAPLP